MKKILAVLAAGTALYAMPAAAQTVSGDVKITGSVAAKCLVVQGGTANGSTFAGTIALGELAGSDGKLRSDVETTFDTQATALTIQVTCNSAKPTVTVDANEIAAQTATGTPPTGYANKIHYTANVKFTHVTGNQTVSNDSLTNGAATSLQLADRLVTSAENVEIDGSNIRTPNATDILVADTSYEGHILITVAPTA